MKTDYIIVGAGLAGLCMAFTLYKANKTFVVFDGDIRSSSKVAGGMFNPVVLKRFTSIWESEAQLKLADDFYPQVEKFLDASFYHQMPIFRKFASIEEQNNWFLACDNPSMAPFLNPKLFNEQLKGIKSSFYFGEVYNTGFLNVNQFVTSYQNCLKRTDVLRSEYFDHKSLIINDSSIFYKDIEAKHLIFADGFSILNNPLFHYLPVDGTKGELLYVRIPNLKLKVIVKSGVFIIPIGNDLYKVGATYNWEDKTDATTEAAKKELIEGLEELLDYEYEVINHVAGIRPTVKDRRPLVGAHYQHKNVFVLNGLGTRGVLLAPYLAEKLLLNIENDVPLDKNIDVARYYKKLQLIK